MLGIVFLCNSFVTARFDMASIPAIIATDASGTAGCITCVIHLHDIGIRNTEICGQVHEIQASRFLTNMALEVANREIVNEHHLRLNPVTEGLIGKASGIEYNEFIGVNSLTNLC
jgi:hypothetical protein